MDMEASFRSAVAEQYLVPAQQTPHHAQPRFHNQTRQPMPSGLTTQHDFLSQNHHVQSHDAFTYSPSQLQGEQHPLSAPSPRGSIASSTYTNELASPVVSYNQSSSIPTNFDPTDYSAQGLDESAFSSNISFQWPPFLATGALGASSQGPTFVQSDPPPMEDFTKPLDLQSQLPFVPPMSQYNPTPSFSAPAPIFGMYGSSYIDVQDDARPFKRLRSESMPSTYLQREDYGGHVSPKSQIPAAGDTLESFFDPSSLNLPPPSGGNYPGLYSESGFDLVGVLARVCARPKPVIDIGPIDSSTSFVVCDARRLDYPIVYASETFTRLTGYPSSEILGRNCRFLQSPTGALEKGTQRMDTDGRAVKHLQKHLLSAKECQASLVNYKKGGEPFINLVTVVPITWDSDEITYYVGFQVNLVDQPNAILNRMRAGTYVINYTLLPSSDPSGSLTSAHQIEVDPKEQAKKTAERQLAQVAQANLALKKLRGTFGDGKESTTQVFETLVEECDDMIHVLSLKGSLLYVSSAAERILNYSSSELLGKNLQRVCHPSDWIAVQRELKESSSGDDGNVHLLYRVRRKGAGYVWVEAHGRLYTESKGRKYVVLVARERPVCRLSWTELQDAGGLGDCEFWSKISLDGTYLDVGSSIERVIGRTSTAMLGTTIKESLPSEYHEPTLRLIAEAAAGQRGSLRHRMHGRSRSPVEVVTHFWPAKPEPRRDGHLGETMPETNFVICQTNEVGSEGRRLSAATEWEAKYEERLESGSGSIKVTTSPEEVKRLAEIITTFKSIEGGHPALTRDNVFHDIDASHSSSWLYEIHLLENLNKKLRSERDSLLAVRSSCQRGRKRTLSEAQSDNILSS